MISIPTDASLRHDPRMLVAGSPWPTRVVLYVGYVCLLGGSLSFLLLLGLGSGALIEFFERFAPDGNIGLVERFEWLLTNAAGLVGLSGLWLVLFNRERNPLALPTLGIALIGIAVSWGYLMHRSGFSMPFVFTQEGFLELLTATIFIGTSLFLAYVLVGRPRRHGAVLNARAEKILAALLAGGCFFIGMEEISWGQTYLGFAGPDWLISLNQQDESNLHNLLTRDTLDLFTAIVLGSVVFILGVMRRVMTNSTSSLIRTYAPDIGLVFLGLILLFAITRLHSEIAEFLLSLLVGAYVLGAYRKRRSLAFGADNRPIP